MKYIIDVEKIEGTNLWKAKEFNALVFDKNGLMRMMTLEDELGDYYVDLRNRVETQQREIDFLAKISENATEQRVYSCEKVEELEHKIKSLNGMLKRAFKEKEELKEQIKKLEYSVGNTVMMENKALRKDNEELKKYNNHLEKEWKDFDNICTKLKNENEDLKVELKEHKTVCKVAFEDIEGLKNENKALVEQNSALEDEVVDFEVICTKLHNEKAELLEKINSLENKLLEKSVPIEEVVDTEQVVRLMTNQLEHSEREYGRLLHKIKCQKGMLKKQGKEISQLQKQNEKLKNSISFWKSVLDE